MSCRQYLQRALTVLAVGLLLVSCGTPPDASSPSEAPAASSAVTQSTADKPVTTSRPQSDASFSGITFPLTISDWNGNKTTFEHQPQRVILATGTAFNIWYDVGGEAIGSTNRSENIKLLPEVSAAMQPLPQLGPTYGLDQESLVALNPDLVITTISTQDRLSKTLRDMGIKVINMTLRTQDDIAMAYEIFGALNHNHDKAVDRIAQMSAKVDQVKAKFPSQDETKIVIVYVTSQALSVKLDTSIAGTMAKTLGLENVASGRTPNAPNSEHTPLDIEFLAQTQPDVVLVTSMISNNEEAKARLEASFASNSAWQAVDAVRAGKVYYLPQQYFLFNPGPYYPEALEYLAACIHPEIFGQPKV